MGFYVISYIAPSQEKGKIDIMRVKLRKIGNSLGILIPKSVITGKLAGDEIEVTISDTPVITIDNQIKLDGDVKTENSLQEGVGECGTGQP